jgi:transcriptional adapter 2-alpha
VELQLKQKVYQFQEYRMMGLRTQKEALKYEQEKSSRNSKLSGGYEKMFPKKVAEKHAPSTQHPIRLSLPGTPVLARSAVKPKNIPIATSPSYELLLPEEQKLCHSLNIYPKAYLSIKDVLIKENLAMGLKSKHVKQLLKIDGGKAQIIFDFFKQLGWIHS